MSNPTAEKVAAPLRNLKAIAEQINMQRVAGVDALFCTVQLDGRDLEWVDNALSILRQIYACAECNKQDVSAAVTCHNSRCRNYAEELTIYEGWR